jgi:hypothetical protein
MRLGRVLAKQLGAGLGLKKRHLFIMTEIAAPERRQGEGAAT